VLKTMLLTKLKIATAVVVVVAVLAAAASSLKLPAPAAEPPPPKADKPTAVQATPKPARPGRLLVWKGDGFVSVTPDGQEGDRLPGQVDKLFLNEPVVAPDGKRVAFTVNDEPKLDAHGFRRRKVFVRDLDGKDPGQTFPVNALNLFWSPDGRALYAVWSQRGKEPKDVVLRLSLIDLATGETKPIDLPPSVHPFAITPGDKTIVVAEYDGTFRPRKIFLALIPRGGTDLTRLTEIWTKEPEARVSPDGNRILFQDSGPADKPGGNEASSHRLFVYDLTTKTRNQLAEIPPNAAIVGFCWSPDGKKVAYTWRQAQPGEPPPDWAKSKNDPKLKPGTESFLVIADPDGKHPKTVLSGSDATTIATVDWR
jgi:dipeptidyl aminopeptidase/acylaminoacyl peptidase